MKLAIKIRFFLTNPNNTKKEKMAEIGAVSAEVAETKEMEAEHQSKVSFPAKVDDGKELVALGCRKKGVIGINFKIYSFGMYGCGRNLI